MPYESKAQQRFMHAQKPGLAKEFDKKTKNFKALPEHADNIPTKLHLGDHIMPIERADGNSFLKKEVSDDDTMMGRFAKRMASRDYIDALNLGKGTKAQKAATADGEAPKASSASFADNIPDKFNMTNVAKGTEVEKEHKDTYKKVAEGKVPVKEAPKEVAKDHLEESRNYYKNWDEKEELLKKPKVESEEKPVSNMADQARKMGRVFGHEFK